MRGIELVARLDRRDEFDRHEMTALVKQLEHGVLRVGADAAPGDRRGGAAGRRAVEPDALAVRFHFELLEIGRKQPQPLVIGEHGARLGAADIGVKEVDEGGERSAHCVRAARGGNGGPSPPRLRAGFRTRPSPSASAAGKPIDDQSE